MKRPLIALLTVLLFLGGAAIGQERHNSLAVDEQLLDEAGPYYFVAQGDSSNAYAKAGPLAAALGVELSYDSESRSLVFAGRGVSARMRATSDIAGGLPKRSGVLQANGEDIASPMAIIVDGTSYVPIVPIAKAFGCDYAWHGQYRLITVNTPPAPAPTSERRRDDTTPDLARESGSGRFVEAFRIGVHEDFTRVAVDLDEVEGYSIAVRGDTMIVTFEAEGTGTALEERHGDVRTVYFAHSGGRPALVIQARHTLGVDGTGFRVGRTEGNTLYIDFGQRLKGPQVEQLATEWAAEAPTPAAREGDLIPEPIAAAPAQPVQSRPTVVLDAGHGGRFAGARGVGNVKEEEIVLQVALKTKALLEAQGVEVILTRDRNVQLSDSYRDDLSARAKFATSDRNLFVSIHANAAANRDAQGIETFVFGQPLDPQLIQRAIQENGGGNDAIGKALTDEAMRIANDDAGRILGESQLNYSRRLAQLVQGSLVEATGARDRGVKQNALFVIRNARTPAILVELGFVSNPEEGRKLATNAYQQTLAAALADGILDFLHSGGTLAAR